MSTSQLTKTESSELGIRSITLGHGADAVCVEVGPRFTWSDGSRLREMPAKLEPAGTFVTVWCPDAFARSRDAEAFETDDAQIVGVALGLIDGVCPPSAFADLLDEGGPALDPTCRGLVSFLLRKLDGDAFSERVHVRTWRTGVVEITDMENAGKRGKACRVLRIIGHDNEYGLNLASSWMNEPTRLLIRWAAGLNPARSFDDVTAEAQAQVATWNADLRPAGDGLIDVVEKTIRGVDAPVVTRRAIEPGAFEAFADANGVWVQNLADTNNLWTETSRGKGRVAYGKALKVWAQVAACKTFTAAVEVLEAAGIEFRGYCAMD